MRSREEYEQRRSGVCLIPKFLNAFVIRHTLAISFRMVLTYFSGGKAVGAWNCLHNYIWYRC